MSANKVPKLKTPQSKLRVPVSLTPPVLVGDVVRCLVSPVKFGRTSITVLVTVEAERGTETHKVTEAEVVYVGVDPTTPERRPIPLLPV